MSHAFRRTRSRAGRRSLVAVALVACFALAACSEGSADEADPSSGDIDVSSFEESAIGFEAAVTEFSGPTEPQAAVPDKKLMVISCTQATEGCALPSATAVEAAEALGWEASVFDGQGNPDVYNKGIEQAITTNVDGILLIAISDELVAESVKKAREAGIVVFSQDSANTPSDTGVVYENNGRLDEQAKALADYLVWQTGGRANVLLMWDREYKSVLAFNEAFKAAMAECETCEISQERDFVVTDIATKMPQVVVSTLRQHPEINVVVNFDAANLLTIPEVAAAGLPEQPMFGSFNGVGPAVDLVRNGQMAATVGQAMEWASWASVDNFNRVFAGGEPVDQNVPMRLITPNNVDDIDEGKPWDGDIDFRSEFRALWGV